MIENNDVREIQIKIKRHIEQLEQKVKSSKTYWNNNDLKFDKQFVQNFINGHYNEIVHHLSEIKHHLEQINYHKKEIDDIQLYITSRETSTGSPEAPNDNDDNKTVKRPEEDKIRSKSRRLARTSSLKYVLQWEKMLDEQKEESCTNSVKRRLKNENYEAESAERGVTKVMVQSRVKQFEGIQKPKRISSTYETFLDFSGEKPKRANSFPILEEPDEEDDIERPKSCTLEICSANDSSCENLEKSPECDEGYSKEDQFVMSSENLEESNDQSNDTGLNIITSEDEENKETQLENEFEDCTKISSVPSLPEQTEPIADKVPIKPRIVEVHLKQTTMPETNS